MFEDNKITPLAYSLRLLSIKFDYVNVLCSLLLQNQPGANLRRVEGGTYPLYFNKILYNIYIVCLLNFNKILLSILSFSYLCLVWWSSSPLRFTNFFLSFKTYFHSNPCIFLELSHYIFFLDYI